MALLSAHAASIWFALLMLLGVPDDWLTHWQTYWATHWRTLGRTPGRRIKDDVRCREDAGADRLTAECRQRAAFLAMLMAEIAGMRRVIKDYEIGTEDLRERLNTASAQSLVLRATVEILEQRIAVLKHRLAQRDTPLPLTTEANEPPSD